MKLGESATETSAVNSVEPTVTSAVLPMTRTLLESAESGPSRAKEAKRDEPCVDFPSFSEQHARLDA